MCLKNLWLYVVFSPVTKILIRHYATMLLRSLLRRAAGIRPTRSIASFTTAPASAPVDFTSISKEKADCVVIGAGVVGIAVARELALKGREVLVLESSPAFGTVTSSRNSEVIHAGIYYPHSSLKAVHCIKGRQMMYDYCTERGVPHKQTGKLIVATRISEIPKLKALLIRGTENGVEGLRMMDAPEAMSLEPELHCVKALFSPVTGIVDSHAFMLSLLGDAENHGAAFSYNTSVIGGHIDGDQIHLHVTGSDKMEAWSANGEGNGKLQPEMILAPKIVVNSAGLAAVPLASRFVGLAREAVPAAVYARGCYFTLSKTKQPFQHLIYPLPEEGGIGVHVTLDLNGQVKFGPDVEWIDGVADIPSFLNRFDYTVCPDRVTRFYPEIRKYYPNLKDGSLEPGYSGIRPKLSGPGQVPTDFVIQGEDVHGVPGLVNLFGIESPGLTSSMAIAEHVASKLVV